MVTVTTVELIPIAKDRGFGAKVTATFTGRSVAVNDTESLKPFDDRAVNMPDVLED